jgi:hypothetical protein
MKTTTRRRVVPLRSIHDRRRNPRVHLLSELYGCVVALDLPVLIRDASRGGFSVESACPFPVGSEHTFRFQNLTGGTTNVVAICRHTAPLQRAHGAPRYSAGFEFLPQPAENLTRVLATIAAAVSSDRPRIA